MSIAFFVVVVVFSILLLWLFLSQALPKAREYMGLVSFQRGLSPAEIQFTLLSCFLMDSGNVII